MNTILVVEDDAVLAQSLRDLLEGEGYVVCAAATLAEARRSMSAAIDGVLLDWRLPDGEGIDFLRELRREGSVPVLMVTARVDVTDRVLGLELGADDYLLKPVEPRELCARLRVRLRARPVAEERRRLSHGGVDVDLECREVRYEGREIALTRMEFGVLVLLLEHPGRVFTRDELLNRVWGYERAPTTRTVDTHVMQLRTKLSPSLFESVRGIGYRAKT